MVMTDKCEPVSARTVKGAVSLIIASIKLMGQSKSMHSIIDATQREQQQKLAGNWCVNRAGLLTFQKDQFCIFE